MCALKSEEIMVTMMTYVPIIISGFVQF